MMFGAKFLPFLMYGFTLGKSAPSMDQTSMEIPSSNNAGLQASLSALSNLSGEHAFLKELDSYCANNGPLCGAIASIAVNNDKILEAAVVATEERNALAEASENNEMGDDLRRQVRHPEGDLMGQFAAFSNRGNRMRNMNRNRNYGFRFGRL